ncbi:hypothetical protein AOLI_G00034080 [Acnodon oligacanthus]
MVNAERSAQTGAAAALFVTRLFFCCFPVKTSLEENSSRSAGASHDAQLALDPAVACRRGEAPDFLQRVDGALNVDWSEQGACSESTLPRAGTVSAELATVIRTSEHKEEASDETARRRVTAFQNLA